MEKYIREFILLLFFIILTIAGSSQSSVSSKNAILTSNSPSACQENYFVKTYTNVNSSAFPLDMVGTTNNDMIVCGEIRNVNPGYSDGYIFRVDAKGTKLWELSFNGPAIQTVLKMTPLKDGHFLAIGYDDMETGFGAYFLLKFDADGNVIWRKDFKLATNEGIGVRKIAEAPDGTFIMMAYQLENNLSFNDRLLYFKFDANGTMLLSNSFKPNFLTSLLYTNDFIIKDGFSYVVGTHLDDANNKIKGYLAKFDNSSGALLWTRLYDFNNRQESFLQVFDYGGNRLLILGQNNLNATDTSTLMICDTAGAVQSSTFFGYGLYRQFGNAFLDPAGNLLYANYNTNAGPVDLAMCLVNPISGVIWAKHYPQISNWPHVSKVLPSTDGSIFCYGYMDGIKLYIGKFNKSGEIGCASETLNTNFGNAICVPAITPWFGSPKIFQPLIKAAPLKASNIFEDQTLCTLTSLCTLLSINGADTLCRLTDTLSLSFIQNKECYSVPQIQYDSAYFSLVHFSGNKAQFMAKKTGKSTISASIYMSCDTLTASKTVFISNAPSELELGPDRLLCPGNTFLLNAPSGYATYQWQNGNSDSTFKVSKPGQYYITTTDACGGAFSDTVLVNTAPPVPFDAGPDRTKCNNDTVQIAAPSGFLNYSWSNNYKISSLTAQSVVVNPLIDTAYYIKAEKTPGCFAYDTIHITVYKSPYIDLGRDRRFCTGDSVVLEAATGFQTYQWNNGKNVQTISIKSAGTYSVVGTTEQGCRSYDTMKVLEVYPLPSIKLDKSHTLCLGETRALDPGNFASYIWQDGSIARTFTVRDTGTYSVIVTDNNGCKANDVAIISMIYKLPQRFLPQDTSICSYGKLELKTSFAFKTYLWNTGVSTAAITITQPGSYWLQVKDNNNCIGKDSINIVQKQCMSGLYIPTAFTPNNDGANDIFRPLVFGNVKQYLFTIYNRWGGVVFQTSELQKGWNGKLGDAPQDGNVFAWTCSYQFEGESIKFEKGTVILIR